MMTTTNTAKTIEIKIRKSKGGVALLADGVQVDAAAITPSGEFGPCFAANSNFPRFFATRGEAADFMVAKFRRGLWHFDGVIVGCENR